MRREAQEEMMAGCVVRLRSCKCGDRILSFREMEGTTVFTSASVRLCFNFGLCGLNDTTVSCSNEYFSRFAALASDVHFTFLLVLSARCLGK